MTWLSPVSSSSPATANPAATRGGLTLDDNGNLIFPDRFPAAGLPVEEAYPVWNPRDHTAFHTERSPTLRRLNNAPDTRFNRTDAPEANVSSLDLLNIYRDHGMIDDYAYRWIASNMNKPLPYGWMNYLVKSSKTLENARFLNYTGGNNFPEGQSFEKFHNAVLTSARYYFNNVLGRTAPYVGSWTDAYVLKNVTFFA